MNMTEPTISVRIEAEFDFSPADMFPDGVPESWTIEDCVKAVEETRNVGRLISDWNLDLDVTVSVMRPNPAYGGDTVLFGDPPPRVLYETAEVWA